MCGEDRLLAKTKLNINHLVKDEIDLKQDAVFADELLKFEQMNPSYSDFKSTSKQELDSAIGVQLTLRLENSETATEHEQYFDEQRNESTVDEPGNDQPLEPPVFRNNTKQPVHEHHYQPEGPNRIDENNFSNEEMQLRAAYEIQVWKETKEKEFEQYVRQILTRLLEINLNCRFRQS